MVRKNKKRPASDGSVSVKTSRWKREVGGKRVPSRREGRCDSYKHSRQPRWAEKHLRTQEISKLEHQVPSAGTWSHHEYRAEDRKETSAVERRCFYAHRRCKEWLFAFNRLPVTSDQLGDAPPVSSPEVERRMTFTRVTVTESCTFLK